MSGHTSRELGSRELTPHRGLAALLAQLWREAGAEGERPPGWQPFAPRAGRAFVLEQGGPGGVLLGAAAMRATGQEERVEFVYAAPDEVPDGGAASGSMASRSVRWRALFDWVWAQLDRPQAQPLAIVEFSTWRRALPEVIRATLAEAGFLRFEHDMLERPLTRAAGLPKAALPREDPRRPCDLDGYRLGPVTNARLQDLATLMLQCKEPGAPRWDFPFCWQSITESRAPGPEAFPDGLGQFALATVDSEPEGGAEELAGFALSTTRGLVSHVYVHPDHRGRGLGRALLLGVLAAQEARGCVTSKIVVSVANPGARRGYERAGFVLTRRLQAFYRLR